jgi:CPA2 family monovalent cation:H+ antiporter-2
MDHPVILKDIVIILGATLVVARISLLLRAPSIVGFIFTGVAIGPFGGGFIRHEDVGSLAELGLVLLLFIIGLELSPEPLLRKGRSLLIASGLQIGITVSVAAVVVNSFTSISIVPSAILGIAVALSSTAIVLKQLSDSGETDTLKGMLITGILLIQDVLVIAIMLFLPMLANDEEGGDWSIAAIRGLIGIAGMALLVVVSRGVLPLLMRHIVRPGGKEFGTLFAILMAFGGAWAADAAGWSRPLGACIAGLLLSRTDMRHQLAAEILPFRDAFNALFFVSIGMLFNPALAYANLLPFAAIVAATLLLKFAVSSLSVFAARWPLVPSIQVGLGLCTVSEFGYVLLNEANNLGILPAGLLDNFIIYALGTMTIGAMFFPLAKPITRVVAGTFDRNRNLDLDSLEDSERESASLGQFVTIVGYGVNGRNLGRILRSTQIPYCVVEMSPDLAQEARDSGAAVINGDATRVSVLTHAGIQHSDALVVAINDPQATRRILSQAKALRPDMYVLARTHFDADLDGLYEIGADEVISEDFEASIEIAAHLLRRLDVPDNIVEGQIASIRAGRYAMLRGMPTGRVVISELGKFLQTTGTRTHYVEEDSPVIGDTIAGTDLRARTGVTIIAVVRNGKPTTNPAPDFEIETGDILVLVGSHAQLEKARTALGP